MHDAKLAWSTFAVIFPQNSIFPFFKVFLWGLCRMCVGTATVISIIFSHSFLQCYAHKYKNHRYQKSNNYCLQTMTIIILPIEYTTGFIHCYRRAIRFALEEGRLFHIKGRWYYGRKQRGFSILYLQRYQNTRQEICLKRWYFIFFIGNRVLSLSCLLSSHLISET